MKKIIIFFLILMAFAPIKAKAQNTAPPFVLENEEIEFSPNGYTPKAKCEDEKLSSLISYFAIDTDTSSPVSIPIMEAGTFQIFASFEGNQEYEKHEASAMVTINPTKAAIITDYNTAAYSKMENPVKYKVEPEWVEEFLEITVDYYPIESISSYPSKKISAPTDLGLYYTVFNVKSKTKGVWCENKYMIYEIAPYKGKKLPSNERASSVPSSFTCNFQNLNTSYEENKPVSVQYTLSPVAISGEILYKQKYSDGTFSSYTSSPPIAPGEYVCGYFLGSTCIGEGNIFIDKQEVFITIENEVMEYSPHGITPTAKCNNNAVELAFTAFVLDENGNATMEEVPVPIKKCGKYSIIAYPKNTEYFKRTYSYGYIEITPSTPEIYVNKTEFVYDGNVKNIGFSTNAQGADCFVEYYEWDERDSGIPMGSPPSRTGKYLAVITVTDKNGNYNTASKTAIMYIDEISEKTRLSKSEIILLTVFGAILMGAVTSGIIFSVKNVRSKRKQNKV